MALGKVIPLLLGVVGIGSLFALAGDAKADTPKPNPGGGGGGGGGKELLSCETALATIPKEMKATVDVLLAAPRTPENVDMLRKTALTFEATAADPKVPPAIANALLVSAVCLRKYADDGTTPTGPMVVPAPPASVPPEVANAGAKPIAPGTVIKDENGVPSAVSGPAIKGVASNPAFQWLYPVKSGDNAFAIAAQFFGSSAATYARVIELIRANPKEHYTGRFLGETGDAANPNTTKFNWKNPIQAGDRLELPRSWNRWIDQQGYKRGAPDPFPSQAVS